MKHIEEVKTRVSRITNNLHESQQDDIAEVWAFIVQQQKELSVALELIKEYSNRSKINNLGIEQLQAEIEQLKKDTDFQNAEIEGLRRTVDMWKTNELKKIRLPKPPEKKS